MTHNVAIFASGSGSNAENIVKAFRNDKEIDVRIVLTNRQNAGVVQRMSDLGIECVYVPNDTWATQPEQILQLLARNNISIIALAGFLRLIHADIIKNYRGRIVNIHPSLLPAYGGKGMYGHHVHEAVIANHERHSGATVHIVTEKMDDGDIIMQGKVEITPDDTPASLEAKVHAVEYEIYPQAIKKLTQSLYPSNG